MKKKLLALLLASCMVFSAAACGKTESTENTANTNGLGTSKITELGEYKGLTYTPIDTTVTDEEVEMVSIAGNNSFDSSDWFDPDDEVVISYH